MISWEENARVTFLEAPVILLHIFLTAPFTWLGGSERMPFSPSFPEGEGGAKISPPVSSSGTPPFLLLFYRLGRGLLE